jgi:GNAT superfamily N-acetyltransferase
MATASNWSRSSHPVGPFPIRESDVGEVNRLFSDSFTDRYHRDGLIGVRVPPLSVNVWRYAIADAEGGALLWRDEEEGKAIAFNVAHRSGAEGWMGPLAVAAGYQGAGIGTTIVQTAVDVLVRHGARVIGLETMPRTMDNIGFYSQMGFEPGRLTLTVTLEAEPTLRPLTQLSRLRAADRDDVLQGCTALLHSLASGYNYERESLLTEELGLGDTLVLTDGGHVAGFAICHGAPLVEGRLREEVRVLKFVCRDGEHVQSLVRGVLDYTRRAGAKRAAIRVQTDYVDCYRLLISMGGRVRWSDLRMTAPGYGETAAAAGVVLSNWEI